MKIPGGALRYRNIILVLILLFTYQPLFADYYQYVDETGSVLFTDDLSVVPKEQRSKVKSVESEIPKPVFSMDAQAEIRGDGEGVSSELTETAKKLEKEKLQLDEILKDLDVRRSYLKSQEVQKMTTDEKVEYLNQVEMLNREIKQYGKSRMQFSEMVDQYNMRVEQENKGLSQ